MKEHKKCNTCKYYHTYDKNAWACNMTEEKCKELLKKEVKKHG